MHHPGQASVCQPSPPVPCRASLFAPAVASRCSPQARPFGTPAGLPAPALIHAMHGISQVPGQPSCARPALRTPGWPHAPGPYGAQVLPPPSERRRPIPICLFEAESRGSRTRCLRFAAWITPGLAQDSLPAGGQPLPGRLSSCGVAPEGFHVTSYPLHFPLPQALPGAIGMTGFVQRLHGGGGAKNLPTAVSGDPSSRAQRWGLLRMTPITEFRII